jgi:phosphohistidine phosphatase
MADADAATLPAVEIDEGVFKYVLVEARCDKTSMLIVRGYNGCPYHQDVLDEAESRAPTWKMKPLGGGRIEHRPGPATISIYGYSQARSIAATARLTRSSGLAARSRAHEIVDRLTRLRCGLFVSAGVWAAGPLEDAGAVPSSFRHALHSYLEQWRLLRRPPAFKSRSTIFRYSFSYSILNVIYLDVYVPRYSAYDGRRLRLGTTPKARRLRVIFV